MTVTLNFKAVSLKLGYSRKRRPEEWTVEDIFLSVVEGAVLPTIAETWSLRNGTAAFEAWSAGTRPTPLLSDYRGQPRRYILKAADTDACARRHDYSPPRCSTNSPSLWSSHPRSYEADTTKRIRLLLVPNHAEFWNVETRPAVRGLGF